MIKTLCTNLAHFNHWANAEYQSWLSEQEESIFHQPVKSSFDTLSKTIQHIRQSQDFWQEFLNEGNPEKFDWSYKDETGKASLEEWIQSSTQIISDLNKWDEEYLLEDSKLEQRWMTKIQPRYEYLIHALNHSTYHRGQIVTIARTLGLDKNIPITDYNFYNLKS